MDLLVICTVFMERQVIGMLQINKYRYGATYCLPVIVLIQPISYTQSQLLLIPG